MVVKVVVKAGGVPETEILARKFRATVLRGEWWILK